MLWLKAFHIILMVTWFAGLFYLPRLFVYHAQAVDRIGQDRFKTMERKLLIIMSIGAVGTVITGLWLLGGWWAAALSTAAEAQTRELRQQFVNVATVKGGVFVKGGIPT